MFTCRSVLLCTDLCCLCSPANMIAQSQSGTGKTAAFVLTMLSRVVVKNQWPQVCMLYVHRIPRLVFHSVGRFPDCNFE